MFSKSALNLFESFPTSFDCLNFFPLHFYLCTKVLTVIKNLLWLNHPLFTFEIIMTFTFYFILQYLRDLLVYLWGHIYYLVMCTGLIHIKDHASFKACCAKEPMGSWKTAFHIFRGFIRAFEIEADCIKVTMKWDDLN